MPTLDTSVSNRNRMVFDVSGGGDRSAFDDEDGDVEGGSGGGGGDGT